MVKNDSSSLVRFSNFSEHFRQINYGVPLRIGDAQAELSPHDQFCRRNSRPSASKCFFHKQLSLDLTWAQVTHGGLLLCFGLIRTDSWFVSCDDLINVFSSSAIVFFQHFFTPIDTNLFLSDCQIVRNTTRINIFYGHVLMQYRMYAIGRNAQECLYLTVDDFALSVHQCCLT